MYAKIVISYLFNAFFSPSRVQTIINLGVAQLDHSKFNPIHIYEVAKTTSKQIKNALHQMKSKMEEVEMRAKERKKAEAEENIEDESEFEMQVEEEEDDFDDSLSQSILTRN